MRLERLRWKNSWGHRKGEIESTTYREHHCNSMVELLTDRLVLRTNCTIENGVFSFPEKPPLKSILDLAPSKAEDTGFAIYLKSGEYIGHIMVLFKRKPYELSIGIEEPYRKHGYMTEAQERAIKWLFDNCHTSQIVALIGPITPIASRRLCQKHGFHEKKEGREEWWVLDKNDFIEHQ